MALGKILGLPAWIVFVGGLVVGVVLLIMVSDLIDRFRDDPADPQSRVEVITDDELEETITLHPADHSTWQQFRSDPARVTARGVTALPIAETEVDSFARAALDTSPTAPIYYPRWAVSGEGRLSKLTLETTRSDGRREREEFDQDCRDPRAGSDPLRGLYAYCDDPLLPSWAPPVVRCLAFAGAGYGVAKGVEWYSNRDRAEGEPYDPLAVEPIAVGVASGFACGLVSITH